MGVFKPLVVTGLLAGILSAPLFTVGAAEKGGMMKEDKSKKEEAKKPIKGKEAMSDDKMKMDDKTKK
jgi:hypothetical protein